MTEEYDVARNYASIKTDIWGSVDWKQLPSGAQWLYFALLTHESLSRVGVAEWRPGRLAALAEGETAASIRRWAAKLEERRFVFVDNATEEILIRSFMKHDGLLQNPNLWPAIGAAFAGVYSPTLQRRIAHEVQKLRENNPAGFPKSKDPQSLVNPWSHPALQTMLDTAPLVEDHGAAEQPAASEPDAPSSAPGVSAAEVQRLFDEAYAAWPKKTEKKKSLAKFKLLAKKMDAASLVAEIKRFGAAYAATTERQFVPALVVWLNGERWTDELPGSLPAAPQRNARDEVPKWMRDDPDTEGGGHREPR
ncbi:hypothetical protein Leucomu_05840 [Leucobacter muris]|uniref:Uncharacterized protein n=1 Tax=Leucobacter muris TaxID=1935379 RepID=A0ABX5QEK1_9MICO|nr:hypothetical protein [Leucobacter muris]QAB17507.1 hypothetical protein Leucomu_05840 [Leucobacter muris]